MDEKLELSQSLFHISLEEKMKEESRSDFEHAYSTVVKHRYLNWMHITLQL